MSKVKYGVDQVSVLEGIAAVRKRPGMYISSTSIDGVQHLLLEILSNAIDEYLAGECNRIEVVVGKDNSIKVTDNGRGIPFGKAKDGTETLENLFTMLHSGAKFASDGSTGYNSSGGLHGVGTTVTNALSDFLIVTSTRDKKVATMKFEKGIRKDFTVVSQKGTAENGTSVYFLPDKTIFQEDGIELTKVKIVKQLQEFSFLCSNLQLILKYKDDTPISFKSVNGIADYVDSLIPKDKRITNTFQAKATEGKYNIEVALCYSTNYTETVKAYTNNIPNSNGTHITGYRSAMTRAINDSARALKILKEKDENLAGDDLKEGLVLVLSLQMPDPVFSGQTKETLTSAEGRTVVERMLGPELRRWFQSNPNELKAIVSKALLSKKARLAAKRAREATRGKSKSVLSSNLQGKLADCLSKDPDLSEVVFVEGDSAGGNAKDARDRETQAIMALQGKVLNAQRNDLARLLKNEEIKNIIQALGCGIGKEFDYSKLRYHKVILMADADVDGSHIRVLLLTFFFKHMPELIRQGNIYLALSPLYKITEGKKMLYLLDESELDAYREKNIGKKYDVSYFKGLGELDPDELRVTTLDPATRRMKQVTMGDEAVVARMFEELMGASVPPRRTFIEKNAKMAHISI